MKLNTRKQLNHVTAGFLYELRQAYSRPIIASKPQQSALQLGIVMMQNDGVDFQLDTCRGIVALDGGGAVTQQLAQKKGWAILKSALLDILK